MQAAGNPKSAATAISRSTSKNLGSALRAQIPRLFRRLLLHNLPLEHFPQHHRTDARGQQPPPVIASIRVGTDPAVALLDQQHGAVELGLATLRPQTLERGVDGLC